MLVEIKSLKYFAKIHKKEYGFYRLVTKKFPFSVYYTVEDDLVLVVAILDQRKKPIVNYSLLRKRGK